RKPWKRAGVAGGAAIALVLAGCGTDDSGGGAGHAATVQEFKVTVSPDTGAAGQTTFDVHNAGTTAHQFVVFKTDLAPNALPMKTDEEIVDEEGTGVALVDEIK